MPTASEKGISMRWLWVALIATSSLSHVSLAREISGTAVCTEGDPSDHIVVYLTAPDLPPTRPVDKTVVLDQRGLRFLPHVLPVLKGTTVRFPNSDSVRHNVFSPSEIRMFNLGTYPPGEVRSVKFEHPGVVELLCNVHPEMSAYILVLDTPYFEKTRPDGSFRLRRLPSADYTIHFWCEHGRLLRRSLPGRYQALQVRARLHDSEILVDGTPLTQVQKD